MNTDKNKKLLGLKNAPKYNATKRRWYTKDGHMVQPGKAYYVKRQNRYVQYNTDGTITELPARDVVMDRLSSLLRNRHKYARLYSIPYKRPITLSQKGDARDAIESRLDRGVRVNPNAVDSILKYAKQAKMKKLEALGLAFQETRMGNVYYPFGGTEEFEMSPTILMNHHHYYEGPQQNYLEKHNIIGYDRQGNRISNDLLLYRALPSWEKEWQKLIKEPRKPPLLDSFEYYKTGNYNSGLPSHYKKVRSRGKHLQNSPELMQMIQNSPYNYDDSNYQWTTFKDGGKLSRQEIVNNFFKRRANKFAGNEASTMQRVEQPAVDMYGNPVPLRLHQEYLPGIEGVNPYTNQTSPNVYVDNKGRTISPDVIRNYNYMRQVPTVNNQGNIEQSYEGISGSPTYLPEVSVTAQRNYAKDNAEWNAAHPNHIQKGALDLALKQALPKYEVNPYFDIRAGLDEGLRDPKMYKDLGAVLAAPYLAGAKVPASANLGFANTVNPNYWHWLNRFGNFVLGTAKLDTANHIIDNAPVWAGRAMGNPYPKTTWETIPELITDDPQGQAWAGLLGQLAQDIFLYSRKGRWGDILGGNNFEKAFGALPMTKPGTKGWGYLNPNNWNHSAIDFHNISLAVPTAVDQLLNNKTDALYYSLKNPSEMDVDEFLEYYNNMAELNPLLAARYENRKDVKKFMEDNDLYVENQQ